MRFIFLLVSLICCIRPQAHLRKYTHTDLSNDLTLCPDFLTWVQLYIDFSSFLPFTACSFPSFPHIFPPSFQFPLSLTHETQWWFLVRTTDFRSVYGRDLRKSTSDKKIPRIHKTADIFPVRPRIRPKQYYWRKGCELRVQGQWKNVNVSVVWNSALFPRWQHIWKLSHPPSSEKPVDTLPLTTT